jgi:hypothetical protein
MGTNLGCKHMTTFALWWLEILVHSLSFLSNMSLCHILVVDWLEVAQRIVYRFTTL